jgi:hypothetical protein
MLLLKCQRCAIGDDHDVQDRGFFYSDFRNLKKHMIGDGILELGCACLCDVPTYGGTVYVFV